MESKIIFPIDVIEYQAAADMSLRISGQTDVSYSRGEFPIKIPVRIVFCAMKIQKIFQQVGNGDQL